VAALRGGLFPYHGTTRSLLVVRKLRERLEGRLQCSVSECVREGARLLHSNVFHGVRKKLRQRNSEFCIFITYLHFVFLRGELYSCNISVKLSVPLIERPLKVSHCKQYVTSENRFSSPLIVAVITSISVSCVIVD